METAAEEWVGALMMAVAAAEQIMAASEDPLLIPSGGPIRLAATVLRDLAAQEIERTHENGLASAPHYE